MSVRVFENGEHVIVRDWDDMEAEFGLTGHSSINCPYTFGSGMQYLCGHEYEVVRHDGNRGCILEPVGDSPSIRGWSISYAMLRPAHEEPMELDLSRFMSILEVPV